MDGLELKFLYPNMTHARFRFPRSMNVYDRLSQYTTDSPVLYTLL